MRVLIFGAAGMLGHMLLRVLARDPRYEVSGTIRGSCNNYPQLSSCHDTLIEQVDIADHDHVTRLLQDHKPEAIVNCAAVRACGSGPKAMADFVFANALWPHRLAIEADSIGARLCHISSDGVFSGADGQYSEDHRPDPSDRYGAAKLLGEPDGRNCITLRTSIIGPELGEGTGLLSWFLNQNAAVSGYGQWLYSGLTTLELSRVIADHVLPKRDLTGVYHLGSTSISKLALLELIARTYHHDVEIIGDDSIVKDRTLDTRRFESATGYHPPDWKTMLCELRDFG